LFRFKIDIKSKSFPVTLYFIFKFEVFNVFSIQAFWELTKYPFDINNKFLFSLLLFFLNKFHKLFKVDSVYARGFEKSLSSHITSYLKLSGNILIIDLQIFSSVEKSDSW